LIYSIDDKQNKMIEVLRKNRSELENFVLLNQSPETTKQSTTLPVGYKPKMLKPPSPIMSDLDKGFCKDDITNLQKYDLPPPSEVIKSVINNQLDIKTNLLNDWVRHLKRWGEKKVSYQKRNTKHRTKQ